MPDLPVFQIVPPLRCGERKDPWYPPLCGAPAEYARLRNGSLATMFVCGEHARSSDVRIPASFEFRRIHVTAEILFSACSSSVSQAHAEAFGQLERAIAAAGGVLNLHAMRSHIGHYAGDAPPATAIAAAGIAK